MKYLFINQYQKKIYYAFLAFMVKWRIDGCGHFVHWR